MQIIRVKYDKGSLGKNEGCSKAPDLILDGLQTKEVQVFNDNVDKTMKNISNVDGDIFVGGDHSISYGSFRGFNKKFKNPGIIIFDAHPDCYPEEFLNHENWVYCLIKEGILKKENVIFIGLRAIDEKEQDFLEENRIKCFDMDRIFNYEEDVCDIVMEIAREFDGLYLSIDIDVLDPAFAPGTGYREVNGLNPQQLFYFLKRIKKLNNLKRVDLVEINPDLDLNCSTISLGKKLIEPFL